MIQMDIDYKIVEIGQVDCDVERLPNLTETDPSKYSYDLGKRHGSCMGRSRGDRAGLITGKRYVTSEMNIDSNLSGSMVFSDIIKDRRDSLDDLIDQYIRDDYSNFNNDTSVVVRRGFEIEQDTMRGFIDGYKSAFEPSYRDAFVKTYDTGKVSTKNQLDSYSIGSADATKVIEDSLLPDGVVEEIYDLADRMARRDVIERGKVTLRQLIDPSDSTSYPTLHELVERYRDDEISSRIGQLIVQGISERDIIDSMEVHYRSELRAFRTQYPACDDMCIQRFRDGFESTYLKLYKLKTIEKIREEYEELFISTYRSSYESFLDSIGDEIMISIEGIMVGYDDIVDNDYRRWMTNVAKEGRESGLKAGLKAGFYRSRDIGLDDQETSTAIRDTYRDIDSDVYYMRTIEHPEVGNDPLERIINMRYKSAFNNAFNEAYNIGFSMDQELFTDRLIGMYPKVDDPLTFFRQEFNRVHGRPR